MDTDILIIGGGTAGCYAALTIAEQSDAKVIIAEKANIKRSGCLAAGVNAINAYIVEGRKPEDYVDYAILPACKSLVEMFMFLRCRGCDEQVAAKIAAHTEGLTTLYDMVFTSYEKNYVIYHLTVCGNTVCGYTTDPKFAEQAFYKHIQDILKKDNYREVSVKIFNDLDKYLTRCDQLKELSSQPELSAGICQTLKSVSL